jgi:hypothetical protein
MDLFCLQRLGIFRRCLCCIVDVRVAVAISIITVPIGSATTIVSGRRQAVDAKALTPDQDGIWAQAVLKRRGDHRDHSNPWG